jgi:hypothetical protein
MNHAVTVIAAWQAFPEMFQHFGKFRALAMSTGNFFGGQLE